METASKKGGAQAGVQHQGSGAGDGQGDPGGGVPRPARRGGGDDSEEAGGEELARRRGDLAKGARGGAVASDVLPGGVDVGRRYERVRMGAKDVEAIRYRLLGLSAAVGHPGNRI